MFKRLQRIWRHRWLDERDLRRALPPELLERLAQRVQAGEQRHEGQVRIHAEAGLPWSYLWRDATPRERAVTLFGKLRVWDTEQNNGVLVYLLLAEHAIEIVADRGLARHVDEARWREIVLRMGQSFRAERFEEGLVLALDEVSALLEQHFPRDAQRPSVNELPDTPTLG
jgi:uncharacterized membrane protein YgcG